MACIMHGKLNATQLMIAGTPVRAGSWCIGGRQGLLMEAANVAVLLIFTPRAPKHRDWCLQMGYVVLDTVGSWPYRNRKGSKEGLSMGAQQ